MIHPASMLCGAHGEKVALRDVAVQARLRDLLAEVSVAQTYRNEEKVNIEAVYTFPLPLDAVLLDIEVRIGARVLKGAVVQKQQAQQQYEEAVAEGDAAVMLEALEPGLFTMNVGNLLPGEEAKITFQYALLYRWTGEQLRLMLPTTVAPRYGASPFMPHQTPEAAIMVENRFSLRMEIEGSLRQAQFDCPTHTVAFITEGEHTVISLSQERAVMDRDFVLNLRAPQAARGFVLAGADVADGEGAPGVAALASFQPAFPGPRQARPLKLAVVVDCSGSMGGDSIEQARQAISGMLDALKPEDAVTLIAFGDRTRALSPKLLTCTSANLAKARKFAEGINADMGGTEIGGAMRDTYKALKGIEHGDIFLITDGEVSSWQEVVEEARKSGHRVFTVGVGSAVTEAFVRGLAQATGGACELVSPREQMAQRVLRHFNRMQAPRARRAQLLWPAGATQATPREIGAVFEGDTIVASACFAGAVAGELVLEIETESGAVLRQALPLNVPVDATQEGPSTVARLAAGARLREHEAHAEVAQGTATALQYRLMSPWTNWLAIAERSDEERAQDLPELRKVPQTLAAGWGGSGTVMRSRASFDLMAGGPPAMAAAPAPMMAKQAAPVGGAYESARAAPGAMSKLGSILRKAAKGMLHEAAEESAPEPLSAPFAEAQAVPGAPDLLDLLRKSPARLRADEAWALLREAGLAVHFNAVFREAADAGVNVETLAAIALAEILEARLTPADGQLQAPMNTLRAYVRDLARVMLKLSSQGAMRGNALGEPQAQALFTPGQLSALHNGAAMPDTRDLLESTRALARGLVPASAAQA